MTENRLGVQTRSNEEKTPNQPEQQPVQEIINNPTTATDNPIPNIDHQNAALNPTVELTRMETDNMEEYIRRFSKHWLRLVCTKPK